ncbi:MAG: hypothetical protein HW386_1316 [Gammaproteobacteria bacterium]|nr:hypothetical protein [Gammaproteobacteria bacterium]
MQSNFKVLLLLVTCHLLLVTEGVLAHESRPIFIQIKETAVQQFTAQWKIPTSIPEFTLPSLIMPESCREWGAAIKSQYPDAYIGQQQYTCANGLAGQPLGLQFPVINPSVTSLFRLEFLHGETYSHILQPGQPNWHVPEQPTTLGVAREYLLLGIQHIHAGVDHLLFIVCLMGIARTRRRILISITGFTLAHSLTLALSTLRLVELPVPPVEALIALSIVFLAHELAAGSKHSWAWRYPITVASSFGLLHGFGFAAVLRAIGLPQSELPAALLFFNLGVEIGQILFVIALAVAMHAIQRLPYQHILSAREQLLTRLTTYLIGTTASFWFVQRVMGFWQS